MKPWRTEARLSDGLAVYDLLVGALRGKTHDATLLGRACEAPPEVWESVVRVESCGPQAHLTLTAMALYSELPVAIHVLLRQWSQLAFHESLRLLPQLAQIADVANRHGIRLLALKGAARLLAGECAGARTVSDIDLLVSPSQAPALHALLQAELGYQAPGCAPRHHLAALVLPGSLAVEIHTALSRQPGPLDDFIWRDTRHVPIGDHAIEIPSPTSLALHTLEHGVVGHWEWRYRHWRYRLRDITDIATAWTDRVDADTVQGHVERSPHRRALETALSAAHDLQPRIPMLRPRSWRTVRRVARARLRWGLAAAEPSPAGYLEILAGVLAEGSLRDIARLSSEPLRRPGSTVRALVSALPRARS